MPDVSPRQLDMMRHASANGEAWRNRYDPGNGPDREAWRALCTLGLAEEGLHETFRCSPDGLALVRRDELERRRNAGIRRWLVTCYGWEVNGRLHEWTVDATSRGAAAYKVALELMDCGDQRIGDLLKGMRVLAMEPLRRGGKR